jgi:hypothetical protein
MNCIIDKTTKEVIWINPDPNRLLAEEVYGKFKAGTMDAVYCPGYQPTVGQIFKPKIANGTILEFQPKTVFNKLNMASRQLESWDDSMEENETDIEPIFEMLDGHKIIKRNQSFVNNEWIIDKTLEEENLKAQVRNARNYHLIQTDKFMVSDYPISDSEKSRILQYRKYLRDFTKSKNWFLSQPLKLDHFK